jgi:hypothetical protein
MPGTWTTFNAPDLAPGSSFAADTMLLLTDGSVLIHHSEGKQWLRLTPSPGGDYAAGSWSPPLNMLNSREYFASGILKDGSVFVIGGETSDAGADTPRGETFDPQSNTWAKLNKPSPDFDFVAGDVAGCVLADGRVLLGAVSTVPAQQVRTALWDPSTNKWTEAGTKFGTTTPTKQTNSNEETWTLLPDGSVLTVQTFPTSARPNAAEKYVPSLDAWVSASSTPQQLPITTVTDPTTGAAVGVYEIGPALLLPGGKVFAVGGSGHTALYAPPDDPAAPGSWVAGPDFPADTSPTKIWPLLTANDAPACLLPGGKVLCVAGSLYRYPNPVDFFSNPTNFFLYDPTTNTLSPTDPPPNPPGNGNDTWMARLLVLPTGQVLYSSQQNALALYTPDPADGAPDPSWKPTVTDCPGTWKAGQTYTIRGTQLNGLSQANSYGDDVQVATNYPLARLSNAAGRTVYCRTFNFSTLGVATGSAPHTFQVQVPPLSVTPAGAWTLQVIANGIASDPVAVQVVA